MTSPASGRIPWDLDHINYPVRQLECRLCKSVGQVKLAWDHQGFLCRDQKVCVRRWAKAMKSEQNSTEDS